MTLLQIGDLRLEGFTTGAGGVWVMSTGVTVTRPAIRLVYWYRPASSTLAVLVSSTGP